MTDHVVKSFDEQHRRLKQLVEDMGKLSSEQLKAALDAIERSDLLSLGANSRSGLAENFIGSTTREFLVHAPCDILVAHVPG